MSRTTPPRSLPPAPTSTPDRLKRLVSRAALAASTAGAAALILPIKWPDALGE